MKQAKQMLQFEKKVSELTENFPLRVGQHLSDCINHHRDHPQDFLKADHKSLEAFFLERGLFTQ